jgi:hypothetical protein
MFYSQLFDKLLHHELCTATDSLSSSLIYFPLYSAVLLNSVLALKLSNDVKIEGYLQKVYTSIHWLTELHIEQIRGDIVWYVNVEIKSLDFKTKMFQLGKETGLRIMSHDWTELF